MWPVYVDWSFTLVAEFVGIIALLNGEGPGLRDTFAKMDYDRDGKVSCRFFGWLPAITKIIELV